MGFGSFLKGLVGVARGGGRVMGPALLKLGMQQLPGGGLATQIMNGTGKAGLLTRVGGGLATVRALGATAPATMPGGQPLTQRRAPGQRVTRRRRKGKRRRMSAAQRRYFGRRRRR